jgi:hypothetical protein
MAQFGLRAGYKPGFGFNLKIIFCAKNNYFFPTCF